MAQAGSSTCPPRACNTQTHFDNNNNDNDNSNNDNNNSNNNNSNV